MKKPRAVIESIHTPGDHHQRDRALRTQIKDGVSRFLYEQTKRGRWSSGRREV